MRGIKKCYRESKRREISKKKTIKRRKVNWIGHILLRNCFLRHVIGGNIEGRIEVTGRRERRGKQLVDDIEERRGYCKLKWEVLDQS